MEKEFVKYKERGSMHWREMMSRSLRGYNAIQQARYEWIVRMSGNVKGKKVIDIGAGDGGLTYLLARQGADIVGIDNEALGIKLAEENVRSMGGSLKCSFVVGSAYELPFPDGSFDVAVSCEVLEHVDHPEKLVAEAHRVLKPGGLFVLTTPYRLSEFPSDPNHVREYYPTEVKRMFEAAGFAEGQIKLTHHVFWYGLYTYTLRSFKRRQLGRLFINGLALWFKYNPFLIDYPEPAKFDRFKVILAIGKK